MPAMIENAVHVIINFLVYKTYNITSILTIDGVLIVKKIGINDNDQKDKYANWKKNKGLIARLLTISKMTRFYRGSLARLKT